MVILARNHRNGRYGTHGFPCLLKIFHGMCLDCSVPVACLFRPLRGFTCTCRSTGYYFGNVFAVLRIKNEIWASSPTFIIHSSLGITENNLIWEAAASYKKNDGFMKDLNNV